MVSSRWVRQFKCPPGLKADERSYATATDVDPLRPKWRIRRMRRVSSRHQRPIRRGCGDASTVGPRPRLQSIVRAYISQFRASSEEELSSFRAEPTVASAIRRAGLAITPAGGRYHHQRRLRATLLRIAAAELGRARVQRATSFDDLHRRVAAAIGPLDGIGELTVYDTALRIGAKLGHLPRKVYLHSGTRAGARALGLNWRAKSLTVRELPPALRVLPAHEIEDCLCIFKSRLGKAV
jgi:hypothetical protein